MTTRKHGHKIYSQGDTGPCPGCGERSAVNANEHLEGKPNLLGTALDQHIARLNQEIRERGREIFEVKTRNAKLVAAGLYALQFMEASEEKRAFEALLREAAK